MRVGTKSVLFGVHCFFIHPFLVAYAWYKLYGFPKDIRLWVAFFVHDIGYCGKENMDGEEGELHPYLGAKIMHKLFDKKIVRQSWFSRYPIEIKEDFKWHDFILYHSRFLAKKHGKQYSRLCVADKYVLAIEPSWMYIPRAWLSGEIKEYMKDSAKNTSGNVKKTTSMLQWHKGVREYIKEWVEEHKDLKEDLWTSSNRNSLDDNGVWK